MDEQVIAVQQSRESVEMRIARAFVAVRFNKKKNKEPSMWKSESMNTNKRHPARIVLSLAAGGLLAGCSGNTPWTVDPEGYDGIGQQTFSVLLQPCHIDTTAHTVSLLVGDAETLYLTMRAADSKVIADTDADTGGACAFPSTYAISISEDSSNPGTNEKVFLDYINGPFALGSSAGTVVTPGITLSLGSASLLVRGSSGVDKVNLGSTYFGGVLTDTWMNVNGDTSPDVRISGVTDVLVTTGPGNDIISADGGGGTTGVALDVSVQFSAYGGVGDDTLTGGASAVAQPSLLNGGVGDDKFVQTATIGADDIHGGTGFDTVDYSIRTAAVSVTVCTTQLLCTTEDDGDIVGLGEQDTVNDDVEIVLGGKGNDTLDASLAPCTNGLSPATVKCTLKGNDGDDTLIGSAFADLLDGGAGDDTLEGGLGSDTFVGGAGVDTVSYADRDSTHPVKVTLDVSKLWAPSQNGAPGELDVIGTDVENLTGGDGDDSLRGNAGNNTLLGGDGNDILEGAAGKDWLEGGLGTDKLYGGAGDDTLIGGMGVDTLIGGDGDDFIDSVEPSGAAVRDGALLVVVDCDGVNDSIGTAGTAPGSNDKLIAEGADTNSNCEF
jgi:Ca2+-binding RTX toxin-like protein